MCDPFWMENFIRLDYGDQEYNCDWSVLYVAIIFAVICISVCSVFWCFVGLATNTWRAQQSIESRGRFSRRKTPKKASKRLKSLKYTLLNAEGDVREVDSSDNDAVQVNQLRSRIQLNKEPIKEVKRNDKEEDDFEDANDPDSLVLNSMKRNQVEQSSDFTSLSPPLLSLSTSSSSDSDVTIFDSKNQHSSTRVGRRTLAHKNRTAML